MYNLHVRFIRFHCTIVVVTLTSTPLYTHDVESEGGEDDWELTNIIGPGDVGRPIARIQEKMESIQPSSSHSVSSSVGSDRPQGQPQSGDDTQKCMYIHVHIHRRRSGTTCVSRPSNEES